jgi:hypothetical protein
MPAYTPTTWVDGVTPVNAANLNKIEAELVDTDTTIGSYLPLDSVVAAATRVQANKLLAGDAQPAFRRFGDGKMEWGPGGATAPDTSLFRAAAQTLQTPGQFFAQAQIVANLGAAGQIQLSPTGQITFGTAADTNLYRSAADTLKTDDAFIGASAVAANYGLAGEVFLGWGGTASAQIAFGSARDTNLYRSGAGKLKTDGELDVGGQFWANHGAAGQVGIASDGKMYFGTALDTSLYRSGAGSLKTDGSYYARYSVVIDSDGVGTGKLYFGSALDASLYRQGSLDLRTASRFGSLSTICRAGMGAGAWGSNAFNIDYTGVANLWIDSTNLGAISTSSDGRYKHSVEPLASTWEAVKQLAPVSYRWRDEGIFIDDGQDHVGFIAQDVQKAIPSGAAGGTDGKADSEQPMSLNLPDIVATMCKALQEAMSRIEVLEAA